MSEVEIDVKVVIEIKVGVEVEVAVGEPEIVSKVELSPSRPLLLSS